MKERHDMSESDGEEDRDVSTSTSKVLGKVVDNASEYLTVREPGALRLHDLHPSTELYLVTIPSDLLDPMKLVHSEMVVGGGKEREVAVGRQRCSVTSYPISNTSQHPSLFLPDQDGALHKVAEGRIRAHVVLRGQPHVEENEEGVEHVDLAALCSTRHLPPSDLKTRHFLAPQNLESVRSHEQGVRKKEKKSEEEVDSPRVSKKKKKERNNNTSTGSPHQVAKGGGRGRVTTEPEIFQDFIGLTQGSKEDKKSKTHKTVAGEVVVKKERLEEDNLSLSDDLFKSPKKKKKKSKKEKLNLTC